MKIPLLSRRLIAAALVATLKPPQAGNAWCGAAFPPFAYSLPWFEFPVGDGNAAAVRVVGDAITEKNKKLSPLLILAPPGLTYEYLEPLEALTISERRVAFCAFFSQRTKSLDDLTRAASAAAAALESKKVHLLAHGSAAVAALELQARDPSLIASIILASPLTALDDAAAAQRDALAQSPAPLLAASSTTTAARTCVDAELSGLNARPAAAKAEAFGTLALRERLLPPLSTDGDGDGEKQQVPLLRSAAATRVPILVTRGTEDVSSEATATRILERVPGARLESFRGAGPLAHVEQRSDYNAAVLAFLDEVDGVQTRRAVMLPGSMAPGGSIKD